MYGWGVITISGKVSHSVRKVRNHLVTSGNFCPPAVHTHVPQGKGKHVRDVIAVGMHQNIGLKPLKKFPILYKVPKHPLKTTVIRPASTPP